MFPYTTFPAVGAGMEAANGAIEHEFHNALVPINGSHSGSSGRSTPNGGDPAPGKLFVGGLSWQTSSEKLREYFGMFGTVTDVLIMKDPVTQLYFVETACRNCGVLKGEAIEGKLRFDSPPKKRFTLFDELYRTEEETLEMISSILRLCFSIFLRFFIC